MNIVIDGSATPVRRPTLLAAMLLKARALVVHSRPDDQRQDLVTLLALVDDPPHAPSSRSSAGARRWVGADRRKHAGRGGRWHFGMGVALARLPAAARPAGVDYKGLEVVGHQWRAARASPGALAFRARR